MEHQIKRRTLPLKRIYIPAFLMFLCIVIIINGIYYYKHEKKVLFKEKSDDLKIIADLKISELINWKKERIGDVKVISKMPVIYDYVKNKNQVNDSEFKELIQNICNVYDYKAIFIASLNGKILFKTGSDLTSFNCLTEEKITRSIQLNSISVTDFYYCELENKIHYDIIAPIKNIDDDPVAIIVFRIDPNRFLYPLIQSWPTPSKTSETLLLKEENNNVLFLNELRHMKNTALSLKIPLTELNVPAVQAVMGYKGILEGIDYRGQKVIAYVSPVKDTDWFMVSKIDYKELMKELQFKFWVIIILTLLILIAFGTGIALFYNSRQKKVFKSLLQAEQIFRTTLYSIGDAVITTNNKGKIKQMNKVAEQITGWRESEAKEKYLEKVFQIINEETREKVDSPFQKIIKEGKIVGLANHTLLITKQGKEIPISDSGAPIKEKNKIIGTVLVFRDQTDERKIQNMLRSRLVLLEYSGEHSTDEIMKRTLDEICSLTTSTFSFYLTVHQDQKTSHLHAWSKYKANENIKLTEKKLQYLTDDMEIFQQCLQKKEPVINNHISFLKHITEPDEISIRINRIMVIPVFQANTIVAMIGVLNKHSDYNHNDIELIQYLTDIVMMMIEKKNAEESLEEERRILNSLISTIPDSIYFKDTNCRFIKINKAMSSKLGLNSPDEAIGKIDADYFGKEHAVQTYKDEKTIIKTGDPVINIEEKEDWKDGTITWVSTTKVPLYDKNGKIKGIMGISRDITDRKKMENELINAKKKAEQSDLLKSAFLANMSHEIRTPLNGILGFTNLLLKKKDLTEEEKDHYSSIINKSSEGLLQVINDILDISRIESGDMKIDNQPFKLDNTLMELNSIFVRKINELEKNLKLSLYYKNNEIIIYSDENRVRQIFINLLDNAVKFTEKGEIRFGVDQIKNNELTFFVSDTGIGIPKEQHKIIFDRFRQAELTLNRVYGGNGLGLSIVKKLLELMGGRIWFESVYKKGTVFKFTLPYNKSEIAGEDSHEIMHTKKTKQLLNILLVEDDLVSQQYITEILDKKCKKLFTANNGEEALVKFKTEEIDIILMDIRLPDINGLDVVKEIRRMNRDVYIIAQTAYAMHSDEEKSLIAGCNDYIAKPIDPDLLLKKIGKFRN